MVSVPVNKEGIPEPELGESCQGQLRCFMGLVSKKKMLNKRRWNETVLSS
ncbi:hypothetical protein TorRG33x02_238270 [Trema orientale]|uniref:Uncharacterized protein n=1 Tax=Trema orientale TaxID=63057 RepID=A0A2P5DY82_TREOI|nr:hypothetical protein TorRG33x02_238270 [Trema orientale]